MYPILKFYTYEMESEINWDKNVWLISVVWCSLVRCIIKPTATQQTCVRRKEPKQKMEEGKRISKTRRALIWACKTYALKVFYLRFVYSLIWLEKYPYYIDQLSYQENDPEYTNEITIKHFIIKISHLRSQKRMIQSGLNLIFWCAFTHEY